LPIRVRNILTTLNRRVALAHRLAVGFEVCSVGVRPVFFLNGLRMGELDAPAWPSSGLDQLVQPEEVEGIEIYETISGLPAKYSPVGSVCGVILICAS
jgi:hypothetical protein